jgi:hypothetical protein
MAFAKAIAAGSGLLKKATASRNAHDRAKQVARLTQFETNSAALNVCGGNPLPTKHGGAGMVSPLGGANLPEANAPPRPRLGLST